LEALFLQGDAPGEKTATSDYRIHIPRKYLQQAGHTIHLRLATWQINGLGQFRDDIDWTEPVPEVVLIERNLTVERVEKLRLAGAKRIICTFDDHYGAMPEIVSAKRYWKQNYPNFLKALSLVDLSVVPSHELVRYFGNYGKVQFLGNFLDGDCWPEGAASLDSKVIGWGGSSGHAQTWQNLEISRGIGRALVGLPEHRLVIYNDYLQSLIQAPHDSRPWVSYEAWPQEVSKFGTGIAPLSGQYDRYRSHLKVLEYARTGVPWVATLNYAYYHKPKGGLLIDNDGWKKALRRICTENSLRRELREEGLAWARDHLMHRNVDRYEQVLWGNAP